MRKSTIFGLALGMAMSANVAFAEEVSYTLDPASGVVENLQPITVTFAQKVFFYENSKMAVVVLENTTSGSEYTCEQPVRNTFAATEGTEFKITFVNSDDEYVEAINEPGEYVLTLKGMFTGSEEEPVDVDPITVNYTINYPVAYTLTPASGEKVENLQGIVIDFTANKVGFNENNRMPVAVLENTTTGNVYNCELPQRDTFAQTSGAAYVLIFLDEDGEYVETINEPGEYTLTIRSIITGDEADPTDLPVITAKYTIEYPTAYTLNPASGETVEQLQGIVIDFTAEKVGFYENNRMAVAVLENTTAGSTYYCYEPNRDTFAMTEGAAYQLMFENEDGDVLESINEPGQYTLTINAMYIEDLEGEKTDLPSITATYYINYPIAYTLTPDAGASVENLQGIQIDFTENKVGFYENNRMPVAVLENTTTGSVYTCEEPDRDSRAMTDGALYVLVFKDEDGTILEEITEPGQYVLTLKGMYIEQEGEDVYDLPNITANYTIEYPVEYTLDPAAGASVENLQGISIDFTSAKVGFYENNRMPVAVLENTTTGKVYECVEPNRDTFAMTDGIAYKFVFKEEGADENEDITPIISEPGQYVLTIKSMFTEDAEGNQTDLPNIVVKYSINYPVEYVLTPAEGSEVENISVISIEFPNTKYVEFYEGSGRPVAVLTNGLEGDEEVAYYCYEADRNPFAETEGILYTFTFLNEDDEVVTITEEGKWNLTISGLKLLVEIPNYDETEDVDPEYETVDLPVIYASYIIVGESTKVSEVINSDVYNVYGINGVQVLRNGDANAVNNLPSGLYIINGKKVLIRK